MVSRVDPDNSGSNGTCAATPSLIQFTRTCSKKRLFLLTEMEKQKFFEKAIKYLNDEIADY